MSLRLPVHRSGAVTPTMGGGSPPYFSPTLGSQVMQPLKPVHTSPTGSPPGASGYLHVPTQSHTVARQVSAPSPVSNQLPSLLGSPGGMARGSFGMPSASGRKALGPGTPVDTNGSGVPNAMGFDTTGDGMIDSLDTTGDGIIDTVLATPIMPSAAVPNPSPSTLIPRSLSKPVTGLNWQDSLSFVSVPKAPVKETKPENPLFRRIFKKIDVDGSGAISMLELVAAMQKDPEVADFVFPGVNCSNIMHDEDSFDAINATFEKLAGGRTRATFKDFDAFFSETSKEVSNMTEMRRVFNLIDADSSEHISRLEFVEAISKYPEVAAFVNPGSDSRNVLRDEECFDEVSRIFYKVADGKKRASFHDFAEYFRKASVQPYKSQHKRPRNQQRVFVIGTGFGQMVNPRQTQVLMNSGYQVKIMNELPNPESPGFPTSQYLGAIKAAMDEFQPDVVLCASKGDPYLIAMWQSGLWLGPSVMINAHPLCKQLPRDVRVVIAHGSQDEVYTTRDRADLERLMATSNPNMAFLYYAGDSGTLSTGHIARKGDSHNMGTLLEFDLLPRLIDAALSHSESPELCMVDSWRDRLSQARLKAEESLGYTLDALRRKWVSRGRQGDEREQLFHVPITSEEFGLVSAVFHGTPKEPAIYGGMDPAMWAAMPIRKIERVENGMQAEGSAKPYMESLKRSMEAQELGFRPGAHTRWIFHGTDAVDSIISNPVAGFQPLASGTKGASLWGSGTYFARDAKYVCDGNFSHPQADGSRRILLCLATVGMSCLGSPNHRGVLPMRQEPYRYDSSVDSLSSPEIFILQHSGAAYPAYVITF